MTQSCPFCLQTDLPDGARKCGHCGSWLDESLEMELREAHGRGLREELREDLKGHRELIETMLKRTQIAGGLIVTAALGAAVFFGYSTDKSITDTSEHISQHAEVEIKAAATDIVERAREEMRRSVAEKLASPETQAILEQEIKQTVEARVDEEVSQRVAPFKETVETQIASAESQLARLDSAIDGLERQSGEASSRLAGIQASFEGAQQQTVESSDLLLPADLIRVEEKGGPDQLQRMLERGVDALSYQLGGYYYGPMVWRYFDALKTLPQFRYVLILSPGGEELLGTLDATTLAAHLDPPDTVALRERLGDDVWNTPDESEVPRWGEFAGRLSDGDLEWMQALPSFRPVGTKVRSDASSLEVLATMEELRAEILPVVDRNGYFAGIVDRSRLTARILLEIARPRW